MTDQIIEIMAWRPMRRNSLLGFASIRMRSLGFHDCPVMRSGNPQWVAMPSKSRLDRDGRQARDDDGKALWLPVVSWCSRDQPTARNKGDDIRRLHEEGLGAVEIGRKLDISRISVWRVLKDVEGDDKAEAEIAV